MRPPIRQCQLCFEGHENRWTAPSIDDRPEALDLLARLEMAFHGPVNRPAFEDFFLSFRHVTGIEGVDAALRLALLLELFQLRQSADPGGDFEHMQHLSASPI